MNFRTKNQHFVSVINQVIADLPIIGDTNSADIHTLAHYSTNQNIARFSDRNHYNWTNCISDDPHSVNQATSMENSYTCMYLIRVGVSAAYKPNFVDMMFSIEYNLRRTVSQHEFKKLNLVINDSGDYAIV